jgi:hypothetical protein
MAVSPKAIYMFNAILINISKTFITEIEKSILKLIWKQKRLRIAKAVLSENSNTASITILYFKLYYRAIAIKTHGTVTKTDRKTTGTEWKTRYEYMQLPPPDF